MSGSSDISAGAARRRGSRRAWRRFRRNRPAVIGLATVLAVVVACVGALPYATAVVDGQPRFDAQNPDKLLAPPSGEAWLGTDGLGRSVTVRLLVGGVLSLGIGLAAAAISVVIGVTWGGVAGYCGGRTDAVMMRIVDVLYGLPYILLVILMKVAFEDRLAELLGARGAANIVILFTAIGSVSWLTMARVVRGQVMSLSARPFVEAARAGGAGGGRILLRHILPNLVGPVLVYATLIVPQAILQESFLSFLGIGVAPPQPTWGAMAADGVKHLAAGGRYWWLVLAPCAALGATLLCLNFVGDGLRDALDPRGERSDT